MNARTLSVHVKSLKVCGTNDPFFLLNRSILMQATWVAKLVSSSSEQVRSQLLEDGSSIQRLRYREITLEGKQFVYD